MNASRSDGVEIVSKRAGFPASTDGEAETLGIFSVASSMSADEVAEVFEFEREIDVVHGDVRADFEHDGREIQHALDAGGDEAVDDGLGELDGHAENRELDGFLRNEGFQLRVGENRDHHAAG